MFGVASDGAASAAGASAAAAAAAAASGAGRDAGGVTGVCSSVTALDGSGPPDNRADMASCDGGIELRRARENDALGIATVRVETWRSAYAELMPQPFLKNLDPVDGEAFWRDLIRDLPADRRPWVAESDDTHSVVAFEYAGAARDE